MAVGGSADAARLRADTFRGLSSSSTSSTVALRDFFLACVVDLALKEAEVEFICCKRVVDLVRLVLGPVFEGSMSAIWVENQVSKK